MRGLLSGGPIAATTVWTALAWRLALTGLGWLWARAAYRRLPPPPRLSGPAIELY